MINGMVYMQVACVQNVLDSLIPALVADKNRKFIYVEQAITHGFFALLSFDFLLEMYAHGLVVFSKSVGILPEVVERPEWGSSECSEAAGQLRSTWVNVTFSYLWSVKIYIS